MLNTILVLGHVPGTNINLTFNQILLGVIGLLGLAALWNKRPRRQGLSFSHLFQRKNPA